MRVANKLRLRMAFCGEPVVRSWAEAPPHVRRAYMEMARAWLRAREIAFASGTKDVLPAE
jgi:hypothetical protein